MTYPRSSLVSVDDTPWYHCVSRCVRRAFLCGVDASSGKDFGHRRHWIVNRAKELANIFAIDIAAYAVMHNHYHLVVRIAAERDSDWSTAEVLQRWGRLYPGTPSRHSRLKSECAGSAALEHAQSDALAAKYRHRLHDLSWFVRVLNESIAKMANAEDACRGRFWEGRFKSQALLDEGALLAAMVYVDLNPVRAGMVAIPEAGECTSIHERLQRDFINTPDLASPDGWQLAPLMAFDPSRSEPRAVPFSFQDYLELVDWTSRQRRPDKRGWVERQQPPILTRVGLNPASFVDLSGNLLTNFGRAVGSPERLMSLCGRHDVKYMRGTLAAKKSFG